MEAFDKTNEGKLVTINIESASISGNMNNIIFIIYMKCDILYANGDLGKEKLISFFYCSCKQVCYCFHDTGFKFYEFDYSNLNDLNMLEMNLKHKIEIYLR